MRSALVRRSVLTASAVSLTLLATACGSDKGDTKADAKPSASAPATSAAPAAKAKTDAELGGLIVTKADLAAYEFAAVPAAEVTAGAAAASDKAECLPVVKTQGSAPVGTPAGVARTKATTTPKTDGSGTPEDQAAAVLKGLGGTRTAVTLASYEGKGAEEAFAAVKTAATTCAGGFTLTMEGESTKIDKVTSGTATGGDEAIALALEADVEGVKITTETVVVRKGNTVATHTASSFAGAADKPQPIVDAQVKKLG